MQTLNPTDEPTSNPVFQPTMYIPTLCPTKISSNKPSFFISENPSQSENSSNIQLHNVSCYESSLSKEKEENNKIIKKHSFAIIHLT